MLFECPPALQVWALSSYRRFRCFFPSTSLYRNMDHFLWRTKDSRVTESERDIFHWILWFIWKAKNDKVFNGKDISAIDTLQIARLEAESWRLANQKDKDESEDEDQQRDQPGAIVIASQPLTCQFDASWIAKGQVSGLGWCLHENGGRFLLGMQECRQSLSSLHAELDGLLWAVESMLEHRFMSIRLKTNCLSLISMTEDPKEWLAFKTDLNYFVSMRDKFVEFSLEHVPREANGRVDALDKAARLRGIIFSHISYERPA